MKYFIVVSIFLAHLSLAQSFKKLPESKISRAEVEMPMRFLAADELLGRRTGEQGNWVAARFIAEQFRMLGLKPAQGQNDYLQSVPLTMQKASQGGMIVANSDTLRMGKEFVLLAGTSLFTNSDLVFVGYGMSDDYKADVKGKVVVAQVGSPNAQNPREIFMASTEKRKLAAEKGAVALIELFNAQLPWNMASRYFGGEQITIDNNENLTLPHIWVNGQQKKNVELLKTEAKTAQFLVNGREKVAVKSYNVVGIIEGTDPVLKNEYVVLSAHFDHIGSGKKGGGMYTAEDSIFNGARDNAFGTVALLTAAKALSLQRPKRSILLVGFTGEEVGLLGSRYYAEHPLVPLRQCVFNLNSDGGGYNDVTIASVIGLNRTNCKGEIEAACKAVGLGVFADPSPEQGLFDRSDNVSFAAKGIPAPTFTPGFKDFNEEITKHYHQVSDNPQTIDFDYLLKFSQAFAHAARLIANKPVKPYWTPGDKYEPAAQVLYGSK
ncbi:MAG: M28 family peptidase [Runella sp.]